MGGSIKAIVAYLAGYLRFLRRLWNCGQKGGYFLATRPYFHFVVSSEVK